MDSSGGETEGDTIETTLQGIASGSFKSTSSTVKDSSTGVASGPYTFNLLGAVKVQSISGASVDTNTGDGSVIQGTLSFAAFKTADITNYLP